MGLLQPDLELAGQVQTEGDHQSAGKERGRALGVQCWQGQTRGYGLDRPVHAAFQLLRAIQVAPAVGIEDVDGDLPDVQQTEGQGVLACSAAAAEESQERSWEVVETLAQQVAGWGGGGSVEEVRSELEELSLEIPF